MMTAAEELVCRECGQPGVAIAYGYPSAELVEAADAGRVVLGGCVVYEDMPMWSCAAGHRWRDESTLD